MKRIQVLEGLLSKLLGMRMAESDAWLTVQEVINSKRLLSAETGLSKEVVGKDSSVAPAWFANAVEMKPAVKSDLRYHSYQK